jgi:hypothetical protein
MKYYIRAWFGEWQEVSKEKSETFGEYIYNHCVIKPKDKQEFLNQHIKVIDRK